MITTEIGRNALHIWQLMNDGSTWTHDQLQQATKMSNREIDTAIGWLAREDTLEIIPAPLTNEDSYKARQFWEIWN